MCNNLGCLPFVVRVPSSVQQFVCFLTEGDTPGLQGPDLEASIATLQSLSETIDAECVELRRRNEQEGQVIEFLIRKRTDERDFMEVR